MKKATVSPCSLASVVMCLLAVSQAALAGDVVYVNAFAAGADDGSTWSNAFKDLAVAIDVSTSGQQLWVAAGTYRPDGGTGNRDLSFKLKDGVTILGGFKGDETAAVDRLPDEYKTILSGDLAENDGAASSSKFDNSRHVVQAVNVGEVAVLDGVIVRAGVGGPGGDSAVPAGGGVLVVTASPRLIGVVIENNGGSHGAGVYCTDGYPSFERCTIRNNVSSNAAGLMFTGSGIASMDSCLIRDNTATSQDGAIRCFGEYGLVITGCTFANNASMFGAGVARLSTVAPIYIGRSKFLSNAGGQASGIIIGASPHQASLVVEDSEFIANLGEIGGVISATSTDLSIVRCTFYGNTSGVPGSCILGSSTSPLMPSQVEIRDSIFWKNPAGGIVTDSSQLEMDPLYASMNSSCIAGNTGAYQGDGQTDADPLFVDVLGADGVLGTTDDDLRLSAGSPLIDAGTFDEVYGLDVGGFPRWLDGDLDRKLRVDMGAHEFSNVELIVSNKGDVIEVSAAGAPDLLGMLFVGRRFGESLVVPYGSVFVDFNAGWSRWLIGKLPVTLSVPASMAATVGDGLVLQILGFKRTPLGTVGNWSNPVVLGEVLESLVP